MSYCSDAEKEYARFKDLDDRLRSIGRKVLSF